VQDSQNSQKKKNSQTKFPKFSDTTEYPEVAELLRRDVSAWNSKAFGTCEF
jgi:hypothetical protein